MRIKFVGLALLAVLFALPSRADTVDSVDYTLKFDFGFDVLTFSLPLNPLPSGADSTGFSIQQVTGVLDGSAHTIDIGVEGTDLIVLLDDFPNLPEFLVNLKGSSMPLFSGDPTHPTLLSGNFEFLNGDGTTLTAKSVSSTSPVPEPSSLRLLAAGMLIALFFKLRRLASERRQI